MPRRHEHDRAAGAHPASQRQPPSQRQLRVGEEIRHILAQLLRPGELRDPALREANITVSEVRVSPDLRNATACVMPLAGANSGEIMEGLRRSAPFLKSRLARALDLRHIPNLVFAVDSAFESAERIAALLASPAVERDLHPDVEKTDEPE
jgi:ribosome-binding factor A